MNATFVTASLFQCDGEPSRGQLPPIWQQNLIGCELIMLLQEMYKFSLTYYTRGSDPNLTDAEVRYALYPTPNKDVDIYARPIAFRHGLLDVATPVRHIYHKRFGFIVILPDFGLFHSFYSKAFDSKVWHCLVLMLLLSSSVFYISKLWERRLVADKDECSLCMELMLAIAACCQQTPPVYPMLISRRMAFFFFFLFGYTMYSFYTSNLLSHLVSDRDRDIDLVALADSDYKFAVLDTQISILDDKASPNHVDPFMGKFSKFHVVNIEEGLEAVRNISAALLSDFVTIYPAMEETYSEEERCQLFEVEVATNVQCYLFTRKGFKLLEEFKIGTLRLLETGLLRRVVSRAAVAPPDCVIAPAVSIELVHITLPLAVLAGSFVMASLLLVAERVVYAKTKPFVPFVM